MSIKVGDRVVTVPGLWHEGEDIGDRLGHVLSIESYVLVEIYEYENNPVKCFRNEIEVLPRKKDEDLINEIEELFKDYS